MVAGRQLHGIFTFNSTAEGLEDAGRVICISRGRDWTWSLTRARKLLMLVIFTRPPLRWFGYRGTQSSRYTPTPQPERRAIAQKGEKSVSRFVSSLEVLSSSLGRAWCSMVSFEPSWWTISFNRSFNARKCVCASELARVAHVGLVHTGNIESWE